MKWTPEEREKLDVWEAMLTERAEAALKQFPTDLFNAGRLMAEEVGKDPRLIDARAMMLIQACADRCRRVLQQQNQALWHNDPDPTMRGKRLRRTAMHMFEMTLMNYALMGGKRLGDATRKDLERNMTFQEKQGQRMLQTATWYGLILEEMPVSDKEIVRNHFTEDELKRLKDLARGVAPGADEDEIIGAVADEVEEESV